MTTIRPVKAWIISTTIVSLHPELLLALLFVLGCVFSPTVFPRLLTNPTVLFRPEGGWSRVAIRP